MLDKWRLPRHFWVILHAVNLRHGRDGFTSLPKEGALRIFSPETSDGFGRVWTRVLGYQRPARSPPLSLYIYVHIYMCIYIYIHVKCFGKTFIEGGKIFRASKFMLFPLVFAL